MTWLDMHQNLQGSVKAACLRPFNLYISFIRYRLRNCNSHPLLLKKVKKKIWIVIYSVSRNGRDGHGQWVFYWLRK